MRTYSELIKIDDFLDRIRYLQTGGTVGDRTFGGNRTLNQILYQSPEWRSTRRSIVLRDNGCDLAHEDHPIFSKTLIHHIEPITEWDVIHRSDKIFDPENLITISFETHQIVHWEKEETISRMGYVERKPFDTCPWKGV